MKKYFSYILFHYTKNFLMILLAITAAIALIDYLQRSQYFSSSNQAILYITYTWMSTVNQFYPLAIVFAATVTYMSMVNSNTIVSLLSFGYKKRTLFIPFLVPAILFYILMIYLQFGEFSYAKEKANDILHKKNSSFVVKDMLFKHNGNFVYVGKIYPIKKALSDIVLFQINKTDVIGIVSAKSAKFDGQYWIAKNATVTGKVYNRQNKFTNYTKQQVKNFKFLKNYKPKVMELIYKGKSLSIKDAYNAYVILKQQNLNSSKMKAILYNKVIIPMFSFGMIILIFFKTPYYARYMNKELVWATTLGGTLIVWGIFYALFNIAQSGAISAEITMLLPVLLFLIYSIYELVVADRKLT